MQALSGMLRDAKDSTNERNERATKEFGTVVMENERGERREVRADGARRLERKGYRSTSKSFVVPELPWLED